MATTEATQTEEGRHALSYTPSAGMLLVKIGRAAERWFTEALKPTGLTPRHVGVLYEVDGHPTSQQALIDSIGGDPSKLVGLLNDLEADGSIVRRRDPEDRRRHIVELSKEGRARLAAQRRSAGRLRRPYIDSGNRPAGPGRPAAVRIVEPERRRRELDRSTGVGWARP